MSNQLLNQNKTIFNYFTKDQNQTIDSLTHSKLAQMSSTKMNNRTRSPFRNGGHQTNLAPTHEEIMQRINELSQALREKNQIIEHLNGRLKNQEQQIDLLVTDAEEKHFHQIKKHYAKSYQKFMKICKTGKYLLLRVEQGTDQSGIYLPKGVKIAHFGELDWGTQLNNQVRPIAKVQHVQSEAGMDLQPKKQLLLENKKPSFKLETSCRGLSKELEAFKNKLLEYSQIVSNSAIRAEQSEQYDWSSSAKKINEGKQQPEENPVSDFSVKAKDAYIKDLEQKLKEISASPRPVSKEKEDESKQKRIEKSKGKDKNEKKPLTSKTYFVRKY